MHSIKTIHYIVIYFYTYLRAAAPAADPGNKTEELSCQSQGQQDGQEDRMLNLAH